MHVFKINRAKAEAPMMAVFGLFALAVSLAFYPLILWLSFSVFPILALSYWLLSRNEIGLFSKKYFLILDEEGIKYCFHIFQQPKSLNWGQIEKVNHQMYEINFKINHTGEMISMQKSYLQNQEELPLLEQKINEKCQVV